MSLNIYPGLALVCPGLQPPMDSWNIDFVTVHERLSSEDCSEHRTRQLAVAESHSMQPLVRPGDQEIGAESINRPLAMLILF